VTVERPLNLIRMSQLPYECLLAEWPLVEKHSPAVIPVLDSLRCVVWPSIWVILAFPTQCRQIQHPHPLFPRIRHNILPVRAIDRYTTKHDHLPVRGAKRGASQIIPTGHICEIRLEPTESWQCQHINARVGTAGLSIHTAVKEDLECAARSLDARCAVLFQGLGPMPDVTCESQVLVAGS
jgi:hypothetical protein